MPTEWGKVRPASCRDKGRRGLVLVLVGRRPVGLTQPRPLVRPAGQAQGPHPAPRPPLVPTGRRQTFPIIPDSVVKNHQRDCSNVHPRLFIIKPSLTPFISSPITLH